MSRRGDISDEDRELFRRAAGDVRRIEHDGAPETRFRGKARRRDEEHSGRSSAQGLSESEWTPDIGPGDVLTFARAGVQRRTMERLRRGRYEVEADLDLHGRIVADAVAALSRFIEDAGRRGIRCVRIVHGKGFGSPSGRPIMKAHVDRWLRNRPEVLAFCSALPPDGGTGALYVLLRR